ncbi:MAG TPA: hypothetical protein VFK06_02390 [Candidatus Angelobacter sp.]|nr:hypothetical protein [Candidatus Angelobacter sp.]
MYGIKAFLLFMAVVAVAAGFAFGLVEDWRYRVRFKVGRIKFTAVTLFFILWVSALAYVYIQKAHFHYVLWRLDASDVYSIQIGQHDFRDQATIEDLVGALHHNRWFEVNHGGWGDTIPLTVRRRSGNDILLDAALYFRESGAIISPAYPNSTEAFVPELPRALERHGIKLPDCDSAHGRPCTPQQLAP